MLREGGGGVRNPGGAPSMGRGAAGGPGDEEEGTRSILGWAPPCACSDALSKSKTNKHTAMYFHSCIYTRAGWMGISTKRRS